MEAVMFTFSNRNAVSILSPKLHPDITANSLRHNTTIELLRLRGRYADYQNELDLINAEFKRRQRWEYLAYTILIAGVVILISIVI